MAGVITGAIIGGVSSIFGANEQANAAESAANTQADANRYAADIQYKMWQEQQALQKPWLTAGENALAQMRKQTNNMPAAYTMRNFYAPAGSQLPQSLQLEKFNPNIDMTQDPGYAFRLAEGQKALERTAAARGGLISGGALKAAQRFGQDYSSQEYANAYNRALTNYSTNQQTAINNYNAAVARAQAMYGRGTTEYEIARQNAQDIYNAKVSREATGYNRLSNLAGVGQTTAGNLSSQAGQVGSNLSSLASQTGQSQANALMAAGNARASAYTGVGSAIGQGIGSYLNYNQNQSLINALGGSNTGGYTGWGTTGRTGSVDPYTDTSMSSFYG